MAELVAVKVHRGRYVWRCTCGRAGKRGYGYPGLAELYGTHHLRAKHAK